MRSIVAVLAIVLSLLAGVGCGGDRGRIVLRDFPILDSTGLLGDSSVVFDPSISADGNGSLRMTAADTTRFFLYEVTGLDIEDAILSYEAELKSEDLRGAVYLEMHLRFPEKGEYLARNWKSPLTGPSDWVAAKTGYLLNPEQVPDRVRLHLVIAGSGTVWVDRIALIREPRP